MRHGSNFTNYYKGPPITQSREHLPEHLRQSPDDSLPGTQGSAQGSLCGMRGGQIFIRIGFSPNSSVLFLSVIALPIHRIQSYFIRGTTRLPVGESVVRIPAGGRNFSLIQIVQTCSGVHPASFSMSAEFLSLG